MLNIPPWCNDTFLNVLINMELIIFLLAFFWGFVFLKGGSLKVQNLLGLYKGNEKPVQGSHSFSFPSGIDRSPWNTFGNIYDSICWRIELSVRQASLFFIWIGLVIQVIKGSLNKVIFTMILVTAWLWFSVIGLLQISLSCSDSVFNSESVATPWVSFLLFMEYSASSQPPAWATPGKVP